MDDKNLKDEGILITKASGEKELFSTDKLKQSLMNAGVSNTTASKIVAEILQWIYPGISTKKIYARAFSILRRGKTSKAIRYKLKKAILELGPTGYPFENLIGLLFQKQGFRTEVGIVVDGSCVTHEMDVIATDEKIQHLIECKYHKDQGKQVSVQVPLYVRSRVDDIVHKRQHISEYHGLNFSAWVITNTRFSADSIQYGKCAGLKLLGWDYPQGMGLKEMLEKYKIYPLTVLTSLKMKEKQSLLEQGIVSCSQLLNKTDYLKEFNLSTKKYTDVINELKDICN